MSTINYYIANSTGELSKFRDLIESCVKQVLPLAEKELAANSIDIIFVSAAALAIPEYGIGGNSPGPNHIYISFDPASDKITHKGLKAALLHEIHHCMRWRNPGHGEMLGEAMVTEGLACLYEAEHGNLPLYVKVNLDEDQMAKANKLINSKSYDHNEWFLGSKDIVRWFGYSYGYKLCNDYATKTNKKASELVDIPAQEILNLSQQLTSRP